VRALTLVPTVITLFAAAAHAGGHSANDRPTASVTPNIEVVP
jgi:hypothetical protein